MKTDKHVCESEEKTCISLIICSEVICKLDLALLSYLFRKLKIRFQTCLIEVDQIQTNTHSILFTYCFQGFL